MIATTDDNLEISVAWSHCTASNILLTYSRNNKDPKMDQGFPNRFKGWKFCWFIILLGGGTLSSDWQIKPFSKLETSLCKYWTSIKTKVSMRCMYKKYKDKITMVQAGAINAAKNEVFIRL